MNHFNQLTDIEIKAGARDLLQGSIKKGFQPVAIHTYRTISGEATYCRARLKNSNGEKEIRPISHDGKKLTLKEPAFDGKKPLYGLEKINQSQFVYLVEGELKADAMNKVGITTLATTGAKSHDTLDFGPLAGKTVYTWADNDDAGKDHMTGVEAYLKGFGCRIKKIDISTLNLKPKGDAYDWLKANYPQALEKDAPKDVLNAARDAILDLPLIDSQELDRAPQGDWEEPLELPNDLPPVAKFDLRMLPDSLRDFAADIAFRMQAPVDFAAIGVIVSLSSLIGNRHAVYPKKYDDWLVYPNMWGLAIGEPSAKKTPSLEESSIDVLIEFDREEIKNQQQAIEDWNLNKQYAELLDSTNRAKAKSKVSEKEAKDLLKPTKLPDEPVRRTFVVQNASVEQLGVILGKNPHGFLCYRDEFYSMILDMEKAGQDAARGFYLSAFNGNGSYSFHRITREEVILHSMCLALLGSIQPDRIRTLVRLLNSGSGDGLLQRFQMAVWPDPIKRKVIDQAPNLEARARAKEVFQRFKDMPTPEDGKPTKWRFSTEAQPIFIEWLEENEAETSSGQLHPIIEGHLGKYPKLVAGLSLIFTLIDKPEAQSIGQAEIIRAIAFAKYLRTHAERIYSAAVIPEMNGSRSLLEKIKSGKMVIQDELVDRFSSRQLARKGWAGLTIPDHATKAADMLVDYGYLKKLIIPTSEKGGRPTDIYVIHPSIMEGVKNVK